MKQIFVFLLLLICSSSLNSQTPDKISFQAIVRNNANELVKNSSIGIKLSIIKNTIEGTVIYAETHKPISNENGLINLEIGNGTKIIGDFTTIDWSSGKFFTKTEIDINGGTTYSISSVNQLLSVPYALYAKNAANVSGLSKSSVGLANVDNTSDIEKPISNQTKTFIEEALLNKYVWLNGTTSPVNNIGEINNLYINTNNGDYYKKSALNTWTLLGNLTGPQGPAGQSGGIGQAGQTGPQGPQGIQGIAGNNGSLWLNGTSSPNNADGTINDFYINTSNGNYYKKTGSSTWTLQANLIGPAGQTGPQGLQGIPGIQGAQGLQGIPGIQGSAGTNGSTWLSGSSTPNNSDGAINDFYINTANGNYYKKTGATTWTLQANLTGPQGPASSSTTPVYNNRFTSTGSYTVPSGVHTLFLEFTGTKGGAGADLNYFYQPSGGCSQPYITRSGGAGGKAYKIKSVVLVNPGDVISFTLGTNGVQPSIENTPCYGSAYYVSPYTASNGTNGTTSQLFINGNTVVSIFGGERGFGAFNNQGQVQAYNGAASTVNGSPEYSNNIDSFSFMITSENISNDIVPSVLIKH